MRSPCSKCGSTLGTIKPTGVQDCVYCDCGKFQYNAPRVETGKEVRSVQTTHKLITPAVRAKVLLRASGRCELCGRTETSAAGMHVGHILSVEHGMAQGLTEVELNAETNLCALCAECNIGMGSINLPIRLIVAMLKGRKP